MRFNTCHSIIIIFCGKLFPFSDHVFPYFHTLLQHKMKLFFWKIFLNHLETVVVRSRKHNH